MSEEKNSNINEEKEDRPIEELIHEKTFQNMSDTEILKIISYTADITRSDTITSILAEQDHKTDAILTDYYKTMADNADKQLQKLIEKSTSYLQTVGAESNVNEKQ